MLSNVGCGAITETSGVGMGVGAGVVIDSSGNGVGVGVGVGIGVWTGVITCAVLSLVDRLLTGTFGSGIRLFIASFFFISLTITLIVFSLSENGNIKRAVMGETIGTTVRGK